MSASFLLYLIEDNPIDSLIATQLIRRLPTYELQCFSSSQQVLTQLQTLSTEKGRFPDCILLDLEMPLFSGWEFLETFHQTFTLSSYPCRICILSASIALKDVQQAATYAAVVGFLNKPLQLTQFQTILTICHSANASDRTFPSDKLS